MRCLKQPLSAAGQYDVLPYDTSNSFRRVTRSTPDVPSSPVMKTSKVPLPPPRTGNPGCIPPELGSSVGQAVSRLTPQVMYIQKGPGDDLVQGFI